MQDVALLAGLLHLLSSLLTTTFLLLIFFSRKVRVYIGRAFVKDTAEILQFVSMGKTAGEVRRAERVKRTVYQGIFDFVEQKILSNPFYRMGWNFILHETPIGAMITDDPGVSIPVLLQVAEEIMKGGTDFDVRSLLSMGGQAVGGQPSNQEEFW